MTVSVKSAALKGIDGILVQVEADIRRGLPLFHIVGLPDVSIKESKERIRSAINNSGYKFPRGKIIINLAPSDVKKEGTLLDLPMALAVLALEEVISKDAFDDFLILGELALDGKIRPVKGVLPIIIEAKKAGINSFIVPCDNLKECRLVKNVNIYPFENLKQVINFIIFRDIMPVIGDGNYLDGKSDGFIDKIDFSDVIGHESNKRALEIAAAGNHHAILFGEPGTGKTMLANRMCTILPKLSYEEAIETSKIHSVAGDFDTNKGVITRPFRNPHHSATSASILGGGRNLNMGEITLAHNGVLYLDEILEFKKDVIESLRQPLEYKRITLNRADGSIKYPCNFLLLASMNPCPCGFYLSNNEKKPCVCSEIERRRYLAKLSKPILDRIDIFSYVPPLKVCELNKKSGYGEKSKEIRKRVEKARQIQYERYRDINIRCNSELNHSQILDMIKLDNNCKKMLEKLYDEYGLTTRSYDKIIKISRTIADLNGDKEININHICEAVQYRKFVNTEVV